MPQYNISKNFSCRTARSTRVLEIAEAFGLGLEEKSFEVFNNLEINIEPKDVVYITGTSGSGKSVLLRELSKQMSEKGLQISDIDSVALEDKAIIDQIGTDTQNAIELLSRAGINDAYLVLRKPSELSDGQRYRLKLAKLFESNADVWTCDEFCAILDRVTAKTVANSAQKLARIKGKILIVATTHSDILEELGPNLIVEKQFNSRVKLTHFPDK